MRIHVCGCGCVRSLLSGGAAPEEDQIDDGLMSTRDHWWAVSGTGQLLCLSLHKGGISRGG